MLTDGYWISEAQINEIPLYTDLINPKPLIP